MSDYKTEITRKELKKLKKKYNSENETDIEFIEWYRRNHGTGYKITIIDE